VLKLVNTQETLSVPKLNGPLSNLQCGVGVAVGGGGFVGVDVGRGVSVASGSGVDVLVGVAVSVGVAVFVGVAVGVFVGVGVFVIVGVGEFVAVGVFVGTAGAGVPSILTFLRIVRRVSALIGNDGRFNNGTIGLNVVVT
jgi:hypothetical protein